MRVFARSFAVPLLVASGALAQNFAVPSGWLRPESSASAAARVQLAKEAIAPLIQTIQPSNGTNYLLNTWESANLIAVIANNDYLSHTTTNSQLVLDSLSAFSLSHPSWYDTQVPRDVNSDLLMWGLACYYASRAYGSALALIHSRAIWFEASQYFVYPGDATRGSMDRKSGTFAPTCNGHSTAGAVFWQASTLTDYQVNGETIGAFVALSAYLCEATSNSTYCESASLSAEFMQSLMFNGEYIIDTIFLDSCETSTVAWSYNTGFLLEGLAVLLSTPQASGATEQFGSFMQSLVASSVVYPAWTQQTGDTAGVMIENDSTPAFINEVKGVYKTIYIRGLHEIWIRSASFNNPSMTSFIEAFLMVQYNAVTGLANNPGLNPNIYSPIWIGPAQSTLLPWGQIPAIEVLNAAILANSSTLPAPSTVPVTANGTIVDSATATASSPASLSSSKPTAVSQPTISRPSSNTSAPSIVEIVLSVLGGLPGLGILIAFFYVLYTKGWTGVREMFKRGWSNRGTVGSTALASDTGVNNTGAGTGDAEDMRQAPVFISSSPASTAPPSVRRPEFVQGSSTRPDFVQGSSKTGEMEEVDAHGISIVSRR